MDYTFNKASSFDYMNSTDLFGNNNNINNINNNNNKNEFIYSSNSSSSIFAHDLAIHGAGGHSIAADDYFNINYENHAEYNTDLLLFDSNDGSNVHMNHIDHGISIEMIKNERDFNFVFENLFETQQSPSSSFSSSTPLSHSQSVNESMSMSMSSGLATLNPVVVHSSTMSSLLLSPSSMIDTTLPPPSSSSSSSGDVHRHVSSSPANAAPFDSEVADKENGGLRLPCYLVNSSRAVELEHNAEITTNTTVNPEVTSFVSNQEKPADTNRRTRNMPSRDQVTGRFKNSSSCNSSSDLVTIVLPDNHINSHQQSMLIVGSDSTGSKSGPTSRSKSTKRSRSLVNNPNRRKRTKFTHEQIEILEKCFTRDTKYPDSSVIENLACRTHLDFHTITIWFQNRRSKDKKMKKN